MPGFDLLHLAAEKVHGLEHQVEQVRTVRFGDDVHPLLPDEEEQIFDPVGHSHQGVELHHGGRAFDGVHDAKDLVHIVFGKSICLFGLEHDGVELFEQCIGFI